MNWRLLTTINVIIALVTVSAVIFDLTRKRTEQSRNERQQTTFQAQPANYQPAERNDTKRIESVEDLTNARVDDLGAVPAAELMELMRRLTPEQLAAMALGFNEAPTDARTFAGMAIFFQTWAALDPKAALAGAFRIDDVGMRELAARTAVNSVSPYAAPEFITFLREHPDKDLENQCKHEFLGTLISNWSQLDPEAASKFVDQLRDTNNDLAYTADEDIGFNWGTLDPVAALEWAAKQKGKDFDQVLYGQIVRGWCRKDINSASAYVEQHIGQPEIGASAPSVVAAMFQHGSVEEATSWLTHLPAGDSRDQAESRLASMWASKDPAATANWIATLPAKEQANLTRTIANYWVNTNWPDASTWIATLSGDARDEAIAAAANREAATPFDSLSLAMSIGNENTRNDAIENVVRNWAETDSNAAERWVDGSSLSREQQDHLRSIISATRQNAAEVERVNAQ